MGKKIELPADISEPGELSSAELECPGVYHLTVKPEMDIRPIVVARSEPSFH